MPRAPVDSMGPMRFNSKDKRAPLLHQTPTSPYDSMVMDDMHGVSKQLPIAEIKHRHFILGCQAGLALQMFIMVLIMMATAYVEKSKFGIIFELTYVYYPLFRGLILATVFVALYGFDVYVWKHSGVDYHTLLDVSAKHSYHVVVRLSFGAMTVVFTSFVLYVLTLITELYTLDHVSKHVWPIVALLGPTIILLWPFNWMPEWSDRKQRYLLLKAVAFVIVSPLTKVTFSRSFIADMLTSMPKLFNDFLLAACLYITGGAFDIEWDPHKAALHNKEHNQCHSFRSYTALPVIHTVLSLLPFWIRLMQCFRAFADSREPGKAICAGGLRSAAPRHLFNAGKYTASLAVALLSVGVTPFGKWGLSDNVWAGVSLFSSVYSFLWDVFIDWGLRLPIGESKYSAAASSKRFVYHSWFYPFAICTNAAARLSWAVYISPGQTLLKRHWVLLIAGIELLRRAQWALLRLEHENSLAQCQCYIHAREAALRRPRSSTL